MNDNGQNQNEKLSSLEKNQNEIQSHEQKPHEQNNVKNMIIKDKIDTMQYSILTKLLSLFCIIIIPILVFTFLSMKEKYFKQINIMNETNSYLSETVNMMNQKINYLTETISMMNQSLKSNDQIINTISSLANKNTESIEKIIITTKSLNGPGLLSELKKREKSPFDKLFIPTISSRNPYDLIDPDSKGIFGTCNSGRNNFYIEFLLNKTITINGIYIQSALKRFPRSFDIEIDGKLICSIKNAVELNGPNCKMGVFFRPTKARRVRFVQTGPNWDEGNNFLQIRKMDLISPQKEFEDSFVFETLISKSKNSSSKNGNGFYRKSDNNGFYSEKSNGYRSNIHSSKDNYDDTDFNDYFDEHNNDNFEYNSQNNFNENDRYSTKFDDDYNDAKDDFESSDNKNTQTDRDDFANCVNNNDFACSTAVQRSGVLISSHLFDLNTFHLLNSTKNVDSFNEPYQWFQIEFTNGKAVIDGFRLKRYSKHKMRNYKIVATDDQTKPVSEWTTLFDISEAKYFENDELGVYEFERPSKPVTFVRLIQTGPTWSDSDYLSFYHFDLFGKYY